MALSPQIAPDRIDRNSPVNESLFGDIIRNLDRLSVRLESRGREVVRLGGFVEELKEITGALRPWDTTHRIENYSLFDTVIGDPGFGKLAFDLYARRSLDLRINSIDYFRTLNPVGESRNVGNGFTVENLSPDLSATEISLFDEIPMTSIVNHGDYFLVNFALNEPLDSTWRIGTSVNIKIGDKTTSHEIVEVNSQGRASVLLRGEMESQIFANEDNTAQLAHRIVAVTASAGDGFIPGDTIESPWGSGVIVAKNVGGNNLIISGIGVAEQTFSNPSTVRSNRIRLRFATDTDDFAAGELVDVGDHALEILEATQAGIVIIRPQAGDFVGGETISSRRINYGLESQVTGIEVGEKFFSERGRGEVRQINGNNYVLYYADGFRATATTQLRTESYLVILNSAHDIEAGDFITISETTDGEIELLPVRRVGIADGNNLVVNFSDAIESISANGKDWTAKEASLKPQNGIGLLSAGYKKIGTLERDFGIASPKGVIIEDSPLDNQDGTLSFIVRDAPIGSGGLSVSLE